MRKFGKLLLVLCLAGAYPASASADGFLSGLRQKVPFAGGSAQQRNQQKADEVASALREARINGYDIEIEVQEGIVAIDGKVRDVTHRALANRIASAVPGITEVRNNLRYVPSGTVTQTAAEAPTTEPVTNAGFTFDTSAEESVQQVRYQKPGRRPAESTATSAPRQPVARPVSQPQTAPQMTAASAPQVPPAVQAPSNQQVAQAVAGNLARVGLVNYDLEIRFENGVAGLGGQVSTIQERQAAEMAAAQVPGVRRVDNRLEVTGPIAQASFTPAPVMPAAMSAPGPMAAPAGMPMAAPAGMPMAQGMMQGAMPTSMGAAGNYSNPHMPSHAWPAYAQYPNSAAITYPTQYSASAWPYIGPFYPYPQVPLGWREASLEWDDGYWQLNFNKAKPAWYWLLSPKNWHD